MNKEFIGGVFMAKGFIAKDTCSFKVGIYQNRDGNILQEGETVAYKWLPKDEFLALVNSDAYVPSHRRRLLANIDKIL